ncbi:NTP transferase domain-containing protein [Flammeovirga yaeyamensis]|uniref:NTP transferase domain-containing protein n=1 Tax=Flammeovirga yaeyamensis TaxID=367791 RepID=A0AAX1N542_9BACT|nr:sugar phosphate nucleotidyltransferase [Flammeovirga yaeyamensis]MBB3698474.1 glucose-1-phosphate thymidylyltransferase [Flammeovirga yaeyamensis]NMF34177.1 NTP transferase domain-containing protein [Flammeovirga yaeyamensis]QWG01162.1 NTP transferase domain-containing protein [Flammeovirga yaeyamensis]
MKVLIPVAGRGSNLRPLTNTQPKALLPVAGKPVIAHIIDKFIETGFDEFIIIIGYMGARIESFIQENYKNTKIKFEFVVQIPREGSAHAVLVAEKHILEEKEVMICLGDSIVNIDIEQMLKVPNSVVGVQKVETPGDYGVTELKNGTKVRKFIERPTIPKSNIGLVGIYKITDVPKLLDAMRYVLASNKTVNNEFVITDGLQKMLQEGVEFDIQFVENWYDCGAKYSLLEANATLLNRPDFNATKIEDVNSKNTVIIPPVKIGKNTVIKNSIIGPNVVIGEEAKIENCNISNSIIGAYTNLKDLLLKNSLVGHDSTLKGVAQSLNLGDHTEINFGN